MVKSSGKGNINSVFLRILMGHFLPMRQKYSIFACGLIPFG